MANSTALPNQAVDISMSEAIVDSEKLDKETINDLLMAIEEIERGEGIPIEELEAEFNKTIWR